MKNVMNKLAMIAVVVALGIASYVVVSHVRSVDSVKIQNKFQNKIDNTKDDAIDNHKGNNDQDTDGKCINGSDCVSRSCVDKKCA